MSKFQIIFLTIFIAFILLGVILFATYKNKDATVALPPITVWGTFPSSVINQMISNLNQTRTSPLAVNYVEKDEANFNKDFIETLARGQGPDAILIPQEMIERHEDKLIAIPNNILTERDFKNTYIPLSELYLSQNSEVLALPFAVDPLVMYWNRDIFTNAGIPTYPKTWDEFSGLAQKINQKDSNANIRRSVVSLGEFVNVSNAREILGSLLLQSGNPVTGRGGAAYGGRVVSALGDGQFTGLKYSTPAVAFFTDFANPRSSVYSWNRSLPISKSWFLSGSLATYFGFSSELYDIRSKNPNLNFDVAPLPQPKKAAFRTTYGKMYGFSIVRTTANPTNTYTVLSTLVTPQALSILNKLSGLPPVRRDMIASGSKDPYQAIFYDSALISRSWLDVDPIKTGRIFQEMVESITSGRADVSGAIKNAHEEFDLELQGT
jgi:ABC-type glycerol-3-phosphate transport system substrate-binding protein